MITTQEEKLIISVGRLMDYTEELYNHKIISREVADNIATQLYTIKDLIRTEYNIYISKKNGNVKPIRKHTNN